MYIWRTASCVLELNGDAVYTAELEHVNGRAQDIVGGSALVLHGTLIQMGQWSYAAGRIQRGTGARPS